MKIDGQQPVPISKTTAGKTLDQNRDIPSQPISDTSTTSKLVEAILDSDSGRVEELKKQYESGMYSVDPTKLAARIINDHKKS